MSVEFISKTRLQLTIFGIVQGVGFRPFVYQLAQKDKLAGCVYNDGSGVIVEIEGDKVALDAFVDALQNSAPPLSRIEQLNVKILSCKNEIEFEIVKSKNSSVTTLVSPDVSLCDECLLEMNDKNNRRYKYPFINCTNCGPRYTITKTLPYDRINTSMAQFEMCDECRAEFENPFSRRYHAQPISCYKCGPRLVIKNIDSDTVNDTNPIEQCAQLIQNGKSIALKGLGGFHIVCDATNESAVKQLRKNKHRPTKPLAVMFLSIKEIKKVAKLSKKDEELILSRERPIVVVEKKDTTFLADSIAPNIDRIGVFLPYTPLHELLLTILKTPIVATSANVSDEPIVTDEKEIVKKLSFIVENILTHDREIINACDDSVVMSVDEKTLFLRLARGFGPKSFFTEANCKKKILAVGANQKNTMTLVFDNNMILSPHVGDLNSLEAFEYFEKTLDTFKKFYNFEPDIIVCDKHPRYETTAWTKEYISSHADIELVELQHHYAHALATMAEYSLDEEVLAFCFDGTGYGDDATLWGGEMLIASPQKYERVYHLQNIYLLGSEKAVREPRRVGLSLLFECFSLQEILVMQYPLVKSFSISEIKTLHTMYQRKINSPQSSSVGRLFDGVYALSGNIDDLGYEGESGLIIERMAKQSASKKNYTYIIDNNIISYKEMVYEILEEESSVKIAAKFLNTLCDIVVNISGKYPHLPVVLCGGVFQNKVLVAKIKEKFEELNIKCYIQESTPVNDGSISLGQAYYALKNSQ